MKIGSEPIPFGMNCGIPDKVFGGFGTQGIIAGEDFECFPSGGLTGEEDVIAPFDRGEGARERKKSQKHGQRNSEWARHLLNLGRMAVHDWVARYFTTFALSLELKQS